ncbi:M18 family aminopeptidase [Williamsia sterculiae]|uniref:M18 family aminopeptidase n=1 Tax=Williamsia sterculiae TaxID=1344003 RepID=A0A1N7GY77_9NOCA|nr:M18 family aminopeptidase [Williamsia sterculiae]SIS17544.1 aspartyl aminopeptidase [Williamsia sterculiae]
MTSTATATGLGAFVDASPSPYHVCASVTAALDAAGYRHLDEGASWDTATGRFYVVRGGSVIAWDATAADAAFRVVGGHTDSPNLRVKQRPDLRSAELSMVGLEPYGGAWLNSWLDRDLGVSGRVAVRDGATVRQHLVRIDEPVLRVPQLAIHLSEDRRGVSPDPQRHLNAVWAAGDMPQSFLDWVCERSDLPAGSALGWELMTHDINPATLSGANRELLSVGRLDNQGTCYAGLRALLDGETAEHTRVLALFDHEEVGSGSSSGAASEFLVSTLERIVLAGGGDRAEYLRLVAGSVCASGDMAHATHPNQPDRHEPAHRIDINGGPVLKVNQNLRYASDARGEAVFALACAQAGVPLQRYVHRADLPCGSTIGPITATRSGLATVDVGAPQLAMHSAREVMGVEDVRMYSLALQAFLTPAA